MAKVHLAANKGLNGQAVYSRCAAKSAGNGQVRRNIRDTYQNMNSPIVKWEEFKATPACDRCAHCIDMAYPAYVRQMKEKGLPVKNREEWLPQ